MFRKRISVLSLVLAVALAASVFGGAMADGGANDGIYGTTQGAASFTIRAYEAGAFVKLGSYEGTANVLQNRATNQVSLHGFYSIVVTGDQYKKTYDWAPSAAGFQKIMGERRTEARDYLFINLPGAGSYSVTVTPHGASEINKYRPNESFREWTADAEWVLENAEKCDCWPVSTPTAAPAAYNVPAYNPPPTAGIGTSASNSGTAYNVPTYTTPPSSGIGGSATNTGETILIYCYEANGTPLASFTQVIYSSQPIYPPALDGYSAPANAYVEFKAGAQESVTFYYTRSGSQYTTPVPAPVNPQPGLTQVYANWTTQQFVEGRTKNSANTPNWVKRMCDGNMDTAFHYTIWSSEMQDEYPELTAVFNEPATIKSIGIVNGNTESYNSYYERARIRSIRVVIHTAYGTYEHKISVPDEYLREYQVFQLGDGYGTVTSVDLYFDRFYIGEGSTKYEMNISEIQFY